MKCALAYEMQCPQMDDHAVIDKDMGFDIQTRRQSAGAVPTEWMLDWGIAWNEYEGRKVVDNLVQDGVVERHDVFNPNNPQFPTAAVRLARTNETVQNTLGLNRPPISNPVLPTPG